VEEARERVRLLISSHTGEPEPVVSTPPTARNGRAAAEEGDAEEDSGFSAEAAIRPERFARLVTLASILIEAGRAGRRLDARDLRRSLNVSDQELREDISVLNVVNFGAGTYVLYAEIGEDGTVEVDPEPYGDSFARPARLLPVEAKALVAAIDLIGEHIPEGSLTSVREKVVAALGEDPAVEGLQFAPAAGDNPEIAKLVSQAISGRRLLSFEYYKANENQFSRRVVEPYALVNGTEGWYVAAYDPEREDTRHFRLDRFKSAVVSDEQFEPRPEVNAAAGVDGWLRTGEVDTARRAQLLISAERARWAREERTIIGETADGSVVVELGFGGLDWFIHEVLKEAGDAVVLEPADAREAVLIAATALEAAATAV